MPTSELQSFNGSTHRSEVLGSELLGNEAAEWSYQCRGSMIPEPCSPPAPTPPAGGQCGLAPNWSCVPGSSLHFTWSKPLFASGCLLPHAHGGSQRPLELSRERTPKQCPRQAHHTEYSVLKPPVFVTLPSYVPVKRRAPTSRASSCLDGP